MRLPLLSAKREEVPLYFHSLLRIYIPSRSPSYFHSLLRIYIPSRSPSYFHSLLRIYIPSRSPAYFHSLLRIYIPSRSLRSVSERRLVVPSQRGSKSLSRTFSFTVPGCWNDKKRIKKGTNNNSLA